MPEAVLAEVDSRVISCARHVACEMFSRLHSSLVLSFCGSHQRRDRLTRANDYLVLAEWAMR